MSKRPSPWDSTGKLISRHLPFDLIRFQCGYPQIETGELLARSAGPTKLGLSDVSLEQSGEALVEVVRDGYVLASSTIPVISGWVSVLPPLIAILLSFDFSPRVTQRNKLAVWYAFWGEANRVADRCLQIWGGRGYRRDNAVERFYREVRVDRIWEGSSEIQRLIIARALASRGLDGM